MNREPHTLIAVRCRGVTKNYGTGDSQVMALRGVDLDIHPAELTLLVGPSGCGKTTLLSVVGGNSRSDERRGERTGDRPGSALAAAQVAFRREQSASCSSSSICCRP